MSTPNGKIFSGFLVVAMGLLTVLALGIISCKNGASPDTLLPVAKPTALPSGQSYTEAQIITLRSASSGANIYYTLDGSEPSFDSIRYITPIIIRKSSTLKAIAVKAGMADSEIMSETYDIAVSEISNEARLIAFEPSRGSIMINAIRATTFPVPMTVQLEQAVPFDTEIEISASSSGLMVETGKVIIREGQTKEFVYFNTGDTPGPVTVTAKLDSVVLKAIVNVNAPMPTKLTLKPSVVLAGPGETIIMTVNLDVPIPPIDEPITINLSSSQGGIVDPTAVVIPAGSSSANFNFIAGSEPAQGIIITASAAELYGAIAEVEILHSPKIVISQIFGAGGNSGSPYNRDYMVLHNKEPSSVNLSGLAIQYTPASGSFSSLNKHDLTGTIPAGGYYLIALASGTNGVDLPVAPDETGNINLASASGIVALVRGYLVPGDTPGSPKVIDFVGYSNSSQLYKGSGPAPAPSAARAIIRKNNGCQDTDDNQADFETCIPAPMNSDTPPHNCIEE